MSGTFLKMLSSCSLVYSRSVKFFADDFGFSTAIADFLACSSVVMRASCHFASCLLINCRGKRLFAASSAAYRIRSSGMPHSVHQTR